MATAHMPSDGWSAHVMSRAYAALLRAAIPTLDPQELREASDADAGRSAESPAESEAAR